MRVFGSLRADITIMPESGGSIEMMRDIKHNPEIVELQVCAPYADHGEGVGKVNMTLEEVDCLIQQLSEIRSVWV